ncbi:MULTISPECIES: nicotinate-nucleotide--dimethylbenzimidazole phosphoribosyltransferase [unclassified Pseudomonas]|uniref:nicotinate-nucleotide--dimethylbenzimidazole phosphoribosyltransferase n=1 Tax=unclassified Pseudomonas TaxID=196821 RepID=UPI00244C965E|nr:MULTISPECIES: nicotinate-nucleotide--dimethylbenzimidazole phosphoribosyltransferase [unclassified Pseudomonas]MDG9922778.1 nicotinate-nucleotide--dimethylbenzimidazole phosphoribosyltransferase [Pseudomonas sp. GD04045]MDH0036941.1 nicotinate-nucleotide--dimethylbenzimidazole phosphoribosyltransferase [Pseudomonas sp. GD04019]
MTSSPWWQQACRLPDTVAEAAALARQAQLTKPTGALGALEALAVRLAALQGREKPAIAQPQLVLFAGDHGVVTEGVSAYPQAVTAQMLGNFVAGGAAVSVLAREQGMPLRLVDLGTINLALELPGVRHLRLGAGTANFAIEPAMTVEQCVAALQAGRDAVQQALAEGCDLLLAGEMGIGNTSAATALACALSDLQPGLLTGPGTGLDGAGVSHKQAVIERALALHGSQLADPFEALRRVGGFELAALAGAYLACAQAGIPAVVDGFICSAAALCAVRMNPGVRPWLLFAHAGAEPGHAALLAELDASPLLDLGLRLGEGSGAALALPLIKLACVLHGGMATFSEALVEDKQ